MVLTIDMLTLQATEAQGSQGEEAIVSGGLPIPTDSLGDLGVMLGNEARAEAAISAGLSDEGLAPVSAKRARA